MGNLCAMTLGVVLQRRWLDGPPERLTMEPAARRELLGHAQWILPATALGFLALHADRLMLGGLMDPKAFGLYTIAYTLASLPPSLLIAMGAKLFFPALSETVRERPHDIPRMYMRLQRLTDVGLVGTLTALAAVSYTHLTLPTNREV